MAVYLIKEKFWTIGNDFEIFNEEREVIFKIKGKPFSWDNKLSFEDMAGNELAFINQKLISLKETYQIYRQNEHFADLVKEFSWLEKEFILDVPGPNDYKIKGKFWSHEYTFMRDEGIVATVSDKRCHFADSYLVDIKEGEDEVSILAAVIIIDQILSDQ